MNSITNFFSVIFNKLVNFPWEGFYYTARVVFIILDVILFIGFMYVLKKALEYRPDLISSLKRKKNGTEEVKSVFDVQRYEKHWEEIIKKSPSSPPQSFTLAIVAADNLVGDALKDMGLEGEHIADRLEKLNPREIKTLNSLWRAHRVRNDLVHTTGFEIKESEAKEVLEIYASFLRELGALKKI
ncbi:MAG: hypothetical protein ABSE68_02670 [Minisyncoccia bacterium]